MAQGKIAPKNGFKGIDKGQKASLIGNFIESVKPKSFKTSGHTSAYMETRS